MHCGPWPAAVPAEPFLVLGGSDGPGAERRVQAYGTVGLPFVVVFATEPLDLELAGILGDPLLVSLGHVVTTRATVLQGQAIPANQNVVPILIEDGASYRSGARTLLG